MIDHIERCPGTQTKIFIKDSYEFTDMLKSRIQQFFPQEDIQIIRITTMKYNNRENKNISSLKSFQK